LEAAAALLMGNALPPGQAVPALKPPTATSAPVLADQDIAGFERLSDEELASNRGGFSWEGIQVNLGAEIRTYLDGQLVLQTNVSWTDAGAQTQQVVSGALSAADAAQLQAGILTSGGISMHVGDANVYLANQGQTAFVHRTDGTIQNILVNTASNVHAVQEVDAALDLGNFTQFQSDVITSRLGITIGDLVGQATVTGLQN
jgi:hypothetical protein